MNGVYIFQGLKSETPTAMDFAFAALSDLGARVGSMPKEPSGDIAFSNDWEYFNPFEVTDPEALPEHWKQIFYNQNKECWEIGYKYIHAPVEILCQYPRVPVKGVFGVMSDDDMTTVKAKNLIHLGGQFTEYDTDNKNVWQDYVQTPTTNGDHSDVLVPEIIS